MSDEDDEGVSDKDDEGVGDEDRADLRGQDEPPIQPKNPNIEPLIVPTRKEENPVKAFFKSPSLWMIVGIVVVITMISLSIEGYGSWKAGRYRDKVCNTLYGIGNYLREDSAWGVGVDSTTSPMKEKLGYAIKEANSAVGADSLHYTVFANAVVLFSLSLEGDDQGGQINLHSPYEIYTYTIYPICMNFGYLDNDPFY